MQPRCPSCNRAWVPGETRCPFCGATMAAVPGAGPPGGMAAPFPSGGASFQLQWVGADGRSNSRTVPPQGLRIGRSPENDVVLDDVQVSRLHAVIWSQGGQCYVQDAGSSNGTLVNNQRIYAAQALQPGDRVTVGSTALYLTTTGGGSPGVVGTPGAFRPEAAVPIIEKVVPRRMPTSRPADEAFSFSAGRGITLTGVLAILLMFFMPWVSCTSPLTSEKITLSGYQIATLLTYTIPQTPDVGVEYSGTSPQLLWLIPAAGLVILLLAVVGLFLARRQQWPLLLVQALLALGIAVLLIWFYSDLGIAREILTIEVGYWGSWVGVFLVAVGIVADLIRASSRPDGGPLYP